MRELTDEEKNDFLEKHIRHRLTLLLTFKKRAGEDNFEQQNDLYCCAKDSSLIAIRMFLNFLGLKDDKKSGDPILIPFKGQDKDVQLSQFVGKLISPESIPEEDGKLLAGVYRRGDKELAHLTLIYNDEFNEPANLIKATTLIENLLKTHLYGPLKLDFPVE